MKFIDVANSDYEKEENTHAVFMFYRFFCLILAENTR